MVPFASSSTRPQHLVRLEQVSHPMTDSHPFAPFEFHAGDGKWDRWQGGEGLSVFNKHDLPSPITALSSILLESVESPLECRFQPIPPPNPSRGHLTSHFDTDVHGIFYSHSLCLFFGPISTCSLPLCINLQTSVLVIPPLQRSGWYIVFALSVCASEQFPEHISHVFSHIVMKLSIRVLVWKAVCHVP